MSGEETGFQRSIGGHRGAPGKSRWASLGGGKATAEGKGKKIGVETKNQSIRIGLA